MNQLRADRACQDRLIGQKRRRRGAGDEGAALVEFAIIAPLLFLLIFGIMEFGWAFLQNMDVRHGAREGARLAAVNSAPANSLPTQAENLAREVCLRMDQYNNDEPNISIAVNRDVVAPTTASNIGDEITVTVRKPLSQLTGFLGFALNGINLSSTVQTRVEQTGTYADISNFAC